MGHYSDLAHTFQGSCPNNDCLMEGDKVCDTPPRDYSLGFSGTYYSDGNSCDTEDDDLTLNNPLRPAANVCGGGFLLVD